VKATTSRLRVGVAALNIALILLVWLLLTEAAIYWPDALARIAFPWADNEWGDGPILMQLHRLAVGQPAYTSSLSAGSFDYGPVYVFLLFVVGKLLRLPFGIVSFRAISIVLGLLSLIPYAICGTLIAVRLGMRRMRLLTVVVAGVTALLEMTVLSRDITFSSLHPDTLMALLLAVTLALYYGMVTGRLPEYGIWLLLAVSLVAAFTKQNSVIIFPFLLAALALTGVVRRRIAFAALGAFVVLVVAIFAAMPPDMRAWTLSIPQAHGYEFARSKRALDLLTYLFVRQYYVTAELAVVALVSALIAHREGARAYIVDGAPAIGVVIVAILAYFKVLGVWNNLSLIALFAAPYCGALVAPLMSVRFVRRARPVMTVAAIVLLALVGLGVHSAEPPFVATPEVRDQMTTVDRAMHALCAEGKPILALIFTDMFSDCANARQFSMIAFLEVQHARDRFEPGLFVLDRPPAFPYVVDIGQFPIPRRWQRYYRKAHEYPAWFGFGNYYYPATLRVWAMR
jgi:hypothetical protein